MSSKQHSFPSSVPVGVVGASGYTGAEVLRLLARHPDVEVVLATSRSRAGESSPISGLNYTDPDPEACASLAVVFLCLPHGEGATWVDEIGPGPRIIDLTSDHRPGSGRESEAVYGLAELAREEVASASLVANPGCYPTGANLALHPLQGGGLVDPDRLIVINAASGVTGAGRSPRPDLLFAEVEGNFRAYGEGNRHRHLKEIQATLPGLSLLFQPHLLPVSRGILESITLPVRPGVGAQAIRQCWVDAYGKEGAVRVLDDGLPALRDVVETDLLLLGATEVDGVEPPVVTVVTALDNLGKGAAGQAVQNMNTMLGLNLNKGIRCERL